MGFGTPPAAAPVYNAPNLAPLLDFQVANVPSGNFAKLPTVTTAPQSYYLPLVGDRALFTPINNITTTVRLLQLLDFSQYALAAEPANCGFSMPTVPVSGRYIYMPQGYSASGVRGSAFYRYDPWLDAWATMAAITTLAAGYRFDAPIGVVSDGGDFVYVVGGWDGADNANLWRYSISGDSWAELAAPPGSTLPGGGIEGPIGDFIYALQHGGSKLFARYSISGDSWSAMAPTATAHTRAGLVQASDNTDLLYAIGGVGAAGAVERYSISGDSWTTLSATGAPGVMQGKGIYYASPVPFILQYRRAFTTMWVYVV